MTDALDWLRSEMEEARERVEAATEGPWEWRQFQNEFAARRWIVPEDWSGGYPGGERYPAVIAEVQHGFPTCNFIAAARTDLPAALSVLDRVGEALVKADFLDMNNLTTEEKNIISALRDAHRERQDTASQKDTP